MRTSLRLSILAGFFGSAAVAQDTLTYSVDGRIGLGYLSQTTAEPNADGFQYMGPVLRAELRGIAEVAVVEGLRFGALTRISYQRGSDSTYDLISGPFSGTSAGLSAFGGTDFDVAVYAALPVVTLSYGDMETAFDLATREIEQGNSILDGGNAVWMNIGDGSGSAGSRDYPTGGPVKAPDLRTLRVDLQVGELTFSTSRSKGNTSRGADIEVDAAGAIWRREFEGTTLFVGAGYDKGPLDRFRSFSAGLTSGRFNVVFNRIYRKPLYFSPGIGAAYDTAFQGLSLSYDFGNATLGFAHSSQETGLAGDTVFAGAAQAVFASWQASEDVSVDFEFSENNYRAGGDSTKKASLAVAWEF